MVGLRTRRLRVPCESRSRLRMNPLRERDLRQPSPSGASCWHGLACVAMPDKDRDERVSMDVDPEDALRALLKVDPNAKPPEDDDSSEDDESS